jgi:hypothetical protein
MKNGQVAVALTSGYLLGRTRKMRWALALASAAAGRRLTSGRGAIGPDLLKSPELSRLAQDVRSQLMAAGRTAAVNAASHRIDALSDRLEQRTNALRGGPGEEPEQEEPDTEREASQEQPEEEQPERGRKPEAERERHPQKQQPPSSSPHGRTARKAGESGGAARKSAGAKKSTSSRTTQGNRR